MKILLVSDTHGDNESLQSLYKQYPNMDLYLHAGDSCSDEYSLYPFISVEGNCDYYDFDKKYRRLTPFGYLLMKHRPCFSDTEKKQNKILIYGHTHQYKISVDGATTFVCPGSLSLPRDGTSGTYAILTLEEDKGDIIVYDKKTKSVLTKYEIR